MSQNSPPQRPDPSYLCDAGAPGVHHRRRPLDQTKNNIKQPILLPKLQQNARKDKNRMKDQNYNLQSISFYNKSPARVLQLTEIMIICTKRH